MRKLACQRYRRTGLWDGIPSDQRPLRLLSVCLTCISLFQSVSCARPPQVVPEDATPPELVWSPPLAYPPALSDAGITGTVILDAMVDTAGRIEPGSIKVVRSSQAAFEPPAIDMLSKSRFRPARGREGPVRMFVRVPVKFELARQGVSRTDSLAAAARVAAGERLAREGQIHDAMTEYADAQALDPWLARSAQFWHGLCWYGSVWGYAEDVMTACEQAVELEVDRGSMRDGRAIGRILTGDYAGAIADLELFVRWTRNDRERLERTSWIEQLRAGQNPLTPEVLRFLRGR